jgi:nucleotide-binding universal stress UspA family protein
MRSVLAAIEPDACAQAVLGTAIALADLFDATPIALHVRENGTSSPSAAAQAAGVELRETAGNATEQIVGAAHDPDVAALVLGARGMHGGPRPAGRTALDVITRVGKPVAVVPPQARAPERVTHILIPLEGTIESSHALEQTVKLAHQHQLEIIVLHIHSPATVPAFSNHEPHGTHAWEQEFLARYIATPHERIKLVRRLGVPADDVVAVAHETAAELLVLAWSQNLSPGRARVVSETLAHSHVPVLLIPAA